MSSFLSLFHDDGWPRVMFDALWQSTVIGGIGIATHLLVRQAAARAWILLLTLSACLFVPLASLAARSAGWTVLPRGSETLKSDFVAVEGSAHSFPSEGAVLPTYTTPATPLDEQHQAAASGAYPVWVLVLGPMWMAASIVLFVRLLLSVFAVCRLLRGARPCDVMLINEAASKAARRLGIAAAPRLLLSAAVQTPMVLGLRRATILLPDRTTTTPNDIDWPAAFTHEMAHVLRRDTWSRLWAELVAIALPLQPFVWLAKRAFHTACEEACDDWAVASGADPVNFAATLSSWINHTPNAERIVAIGISTTKSRIQRLLSMRIKPVASLSNISFWTGILATAFLAAGLAVAQTSTDNEPQTDANAVRDVNADRADTSVQKERGGDDSPAIISISGSCEDENKKPLAKARVRLFLIAFPSTGVSQQQLKDVQTDDEGKFSLADINLREVRDRHAALVVVAQARGRATTTSGWMNHEQAGKPLDDLVLPLAASMDGRVVDTKGQPVKGAIVSTAGSLPTPVPGICSALTDADGKFAISDLRPFNVADQKPQPTKEGGVYAFTACIGNVDHPDYARQPFKYTKIPSTIDVTVHRSAVVHGQVVLAENDEPVAGARLEFWNDDVGPDYWTRTTSDASGNYRLGNLPPGKYRMGVKVKGRPNLFRHDVDLRAGENALDLKMDKGATIKGQVIDVTTGEPVQLGKRQIMQLSTHDSKGIAYAGMPTAEVQANGSFTLLVPAGQQYLGMYLGPNWRRVNTDKLFRGGFAVKEGEVLELEIQVAPTTKK